MFMLTFISSDDTLRCQRRRQQRVKKVSIILKSSYDSDCLWELKCHFVMSHWRSWWSNGILDTKFRSSNTDGGTRHIHGWHAFQSQLWGWLWYHRLEFAHHKCKAWRSGTVRVSNQHGTKNEIEYQFDGERWGVHIYLCRLGIPRFSHNKSSIHIPSSMEFSIFVSSAHFFSSKIAYLLFNGCCRGDELNIQLSSKNSHKMWCVCKKGKKKTWKWEFWISQFRNAFYMKPHVCMEQNLLLLQQKPHQLRLMVSLLYSI